VIKTVPVSLSGKLFYLDPSAGGTGCHCRRDWRAHYWPATGGCYEQESPGPCAPGRYFAYDARARKAVCACFRSHAPRPDVGDCVELGSKAHCPDGQVVQADTATGEAVCGCSQRLGAHYWPADGRCYPHYERGPCAEGEQFRPHPLRPREAACIVWGKTSPSSGY